MDKIDMGGIRKKRPSFRPKVRELSDIELTETDAREERLRIEKRNFYGAD